MARKLQDTTREPVVKSKDSEEQILCLGNIVKLELPIPHTPTVIIPTFQQPIVAVGREGVSTEELLWPRGVTLETKSGQIFVADMGNSRIQIFSQRGEHINQFGGLHLKRPHGILIHQNNVYVTDWGHNAVFLFSLLDLTLIKQVGTEGFGKEEFNSPRQLAISPDQHLYVPDVNNNRIQILTLDLSFQDSLRHLSMTCPVDVQFSNNEIFVLSWRDNPCIHVFTLSGEKSRSLITRGDKGKQIVQAYFFCLDRLCNIIISDCIANKLKEFSPEGQLMNTTGQEGHETGMLYYPSGIRIHNDTTLICVSANINFGLQIFPTNI